MEYIKKRDNSLAKVKVISKYEYRKNLKPINYRDFFYNFNYTKKLIKLQ